MQELPKLIILIGISGSGKSTWTQQALKTNQHTVSVNRDLLRKMLKNDWVPGNDIEQLITHIQNYTINTALKQGFSVIVDNTNLQSKYINQFIEQFISISNIEFVIIERPLDLCIIRDYNRERTVGKYIIEKQYNFFMDLMQNFDFSSYKVTLIK